jgi:hypothetical protein
MKIVELTAIALRIFAICLFLYGLRQAASLAGYVGPVTYGQPTISIFYYVAVAFVPLVIAIVIWMFPVTVSKAFLPGGIQSEEIRISEGKQFFVGSIYSPWDICTDLCGAKFYISFN